MMYIIKVKNLTTEIKKIRKMKQITLKRLVLTVLLGLIISGLNAQDFNQYRHELGIYGGGGLSSLQYKPSIGKHAIGFGGQAGLSYTIFFSPNWGLEIAGEIAFYQGKAKLSNFSDSYDVLGTTSADNYTYSYKIEDYNETQQAFYVNVPLMLQFQAGKKHKFYAALGGKVGFPVIAKVKTDNYSVSTQGYFPEEGRTYDDLPQYGFGTYNYESGKTDLNKLNLNIMGAAEIGVKWRVCEKTFIYTGIYADYGFFNVQKTNDKTFIQSTLSAENPQMSPIIESKIAGKPLVDKVTPLSAGLKIKIAFGLGKPIQKKEKVEKVKEKPIVDNSAEEAAKLAAEEKARKEAADKLAAEEKARKDAADKLAAEEKARKDAADKLAAEEKARKDAADKLAAEEKARQEAEAKKLIQETVTDYNRSIANYNNGQVEFSQQQKQKLDEIIAMLLQHPEIKLVINGHTCDLGSIETNEKVGLQRAQKMKDYMISKGIAESRIISINSKRDTEPLVPNTSEENRKLNRRVEIVVK